MAAAIQKDLHDLGNGLFAYTQLPGTWGWSNAGLIVDGDQSLLIDTLFDKKLTLEMLDTMRKAAPAAKRLGTVVNTHGNGDHCYGNSVVGDAEIIGSRGCVQDLEEAPPSRNALLLRAARVMRALGGGGRLLGSALGLVGIKQVAWLTDAAPLALPLFRDFDFSDNEVVLPTRTFENELTLEVGDKRVELFELGPAHTRGDVAVFVPQDRVVFTGDIVFKDAHPVIWQGPVSGWIRACERLLDLDVDTVVPGHGPVCDKGGIREVLHYLQVLWEQASERHREKMSVEDAARDLSLDEFADLLDAERVYVNVHAVYRELEGDTEPVDVLEMFAGMARLRA